MFDDKVLLVVKLFVFPVVLFLFMISRYVSGQRVGRFTYFSAQLAGINQIKMSFNMKSHILPGGGRSTAL